MGSTLMRPAFGRFFDTGAKKRTSELANAMASPFALTPFGAVMLSTMFALSDDQLALIMTAAGSVPVEKRSTFLERVAARLRLRGPHFTDADLGAAIQAALTGLVQSAA
jgi:hypothetical protein